MGIAKCMVFRVRGQLHFAIRVLQFASFVDNLQLATERLALCMAVACGVLKARGVH
jgi:hypothetical protein